MVTLFQNSISTFGENFELKVNSKCENILSGSYLSHLFFFGKLEVLLVV